MWPQYTLQVLDGVLEKFLPLSHLQQDHNKHGINIQKPGSHNREPADARRVQGHERSCLLQRLRVKVRC
jgi:hypothetical protein